MKLAALCLAGALSCGAMDFPWEAVTDIPQSAVVGTGTMYCGDEPIRSVAIKGPGSYYMLWATEKAWIIAPFPGEDEPSGGTRATVAHEGIWEKRDGKVYLKYLVTINVPASSEAAYQKFCDWLIKGGDA